MIQWIGNRLQTDVERVLSLQSLTLSTSLQPCVKGGIAAHCDTSSSRVGEGVGVGREAWGRDEPVVHCGHTDSLQGMLSSSMSRDCAGLIGLRLWI